MREVSCKILRSYETILRLHGARVEELIAGLPLTVERFRDLSERIDWEVFCELSRRLESICGGPDALERAAGLYAEDPLLRATRSIFGRLASARLIYWAAHRWFGHSMFTIVRSDLESPSPESVRLTLSIPPEYEDSPQFFRLCAGVFRIAPQVVGQEKAIVEYELSVRRCCYAIRPPPSPSIWNKASRSMRLLTNSRYAFEELGEQQQVLRRQYEALRRAHQKISEQAAQLQAVNQLGLRLTQQLELGALGEVVNSVLGKWAALSGLSIRTFNEVGPAAFLTSTGRCEGPPTYAFNLAMGGRELGRLEAWLSSPSQAAEQMLRESVPWITIALENARLFAIEKNSQAVLASQVEERTADLRLATRRLEESLERQREGERAKTDFFANASHELRTPLTLVLAPLEVALGASDLSQVVRAEIETALQNGYRLLKLINDLLDLAKIEAGKLSLVPGSVDLVAILREAVVPWRASHAAREIEVRFELPAELHVVADAERLQQVILNLLSNATKHTPDAGVISLRAHSQGEEVIFSVANTGSQIAEEDLPRLFERFGQSPRSRGRRFGSTGLGLPVVREIVALHGGEITVSSAPDEGVEFTIRLPAGSRLSPALSNVVPSVTPIELRQYETLSVPVPRDDGSGECPGPRKELVLVVEDNVELRRFLVSRLQADYSVLGCGDGATGLRLAREHRPSVILSDLMMPELDGAELCRRLKSDPATATIPVVLLTARGDLESKVHSLRLGADDYLVKPFTLAELSARLAAQVRLRRLSSEVAQREKLAALGTMVAGVAHEIRNPLNGIINSLRPLGALITDQPSEQRELLTLALESASRIDSISAQLLMQARSGDGVKSELELGENVRLALRILSHKVGAGGVRLSFRSETGVRVIADPGALNQVWVNLIDNALQACAEGGDVEVEVRSEGELAVVTIRDDGHGISASELNQIFDPFFTTKPVGSGTGLGLAVCRSIVERHRGEISVRSVKGQGTSFSVTLPLEKQEGKG